MFSRCGNRIRCGLLVIAVPIMVQAATAPSQDFWEYMSDFSDENGEVLDPVEVDQMLDLKETPSPANELPVDRAQTPAQTVPITRGSPRDTLFPVKESSVQSSSSVVSGAKL